MLEELFHELNSLHFRSELPLPALSWNPRLSSTAGRFCPGSRFFLKERPPEIEIASYLRDLPDGEMHVRDTVLHEMIHYFLWHRKRPHGHTAEFHRIMKKVGAKRYNPVPKLRPIKYWYECSACRQKIPTRRKMGLSACAPCCEKFNQGKYHERFRLRMVTVKETAERQAQETACLSGPLEPARTPSPSPIEPPDYRLSPSEVIRRLEELKKLVSGKIKAPSANS